MKNLIIGDGAMGTELRRRGVKVPSHVESIWSALALREAPVTSRRNTYSITLKLEVIT